MRRWAVAGRHGLADIKVALGDTLTNGLHPVSEPAWMYAPLGRLGAD